MTLRALRYGAEMLAAEASDPAASARFDPAIEPQRGWRIDAWLFGVVAIAIRLPALLASRSLVFDDGVFASSALAMRRGELPFREIFSSQGPVFLPLVWLADLAGFRTLDAPRLLAVAAGVLVTIATYSCARRVTGRANAVFAAALVTTSGSVLWVTAPINADGPSLALSVLAVALALRYRARPRLATAAWVGVAAGAAVSIKALSVPAVLIAGVVVLLSHRRVRDAVTAAGVAVGVYLVAALPWGLARVWDQSYSYHQDSRRVNTPLEALHKIANTLWSRDLLVLVAVALALGAFVVRWAQRRERPRTDPVVVALLVWTALVVALLVYEPAMWRAHIAHVVVPLALLAAYRPPPWRVVIVVMVVATPFAIASNSDILWPSPYSGHEAALVRHLERYPDRAQFISDDPGFVWRSGHGTPGDYADTSYQRIDNGEITQAGLVKAARDPKVCGVLSTSPAHFGRFPGLGNALAPEGFRAVDFGPHLTLYQRTTSDTCRLDD